MPTVQTMIPMRRQIKNINVRPDQVISLEVNLNRFARRTVKGTGHNNMSRVPVPRNRVNNAPINRIKRIFRVALGTRDPTNSVLTLINRRNRHTNRQTRRSSRRCQRPSGADRQMSSGTINRRQAGSRRNNRCTK